MKTLHLTNSWHSDSGGIATFYRALLRQAEAEHRLIRLVVPAAEDGVEPHGNFGLIYRVRSRPSPFNPGYRMMSPLSYLLPGGRVRQILAAERPDVVEVCDKYTLNYLGGLLRRGWFGMRHYRPTVVGLSCERMDENMAGYISPGAAARLFCQVYMQWLYFPLFDHHIAVSVHTAGELHLASFGHRKRRGVWVRPMGADCQLFRPSRRAAAFRAWLNARSGAPEGSTVLLYVGRLAPEKNLRLLFDTMRLLEQLQNCHFHLLIAGDGALRAELEGMCARDLPGAVCFLGHVRSREMLADILANSDALVHPNPREPFGIAPLEAMASGIPVIGPDSGGITSYAGPANAMLVEPDPHSFARAALTLRENRAVAESLGRAARLTAESLDWARVASSFFALYDELHAVVERSSGEPTLAPAFYSSYPGMRRGLGWES